MDIHLMVKNHVCIDRFMLILSSSISVVQHGGIHSLEDVEQW